MSAIVRTSAEMCGRKSFVDFGLLPSNGVIAKIVLRDVDLLKVKTFKMLASLKRCKLAQLFYRTTFIDFDICQRMIPL